METRCYLKVCGVLYDIGPLDLSRDIPDERLDYGYEEVFVEVET